MSSEQYNKFPTGKQGLRLEINAKSNKMPQKGTDCQEVNCHGAAREATLGCVGLRPAQVLHQRLL